MSRSLRHMTPEQREIAITRRIKQSGKGLGHWAAKDARIKQRLASLKPELQH